MLQAADVSFAYRGGRVIDGVTFEAARGTIVGLLGPNGSGKTTLLRLLSGTLSPEQGEVRFDGRALASFTRTALARRLAVVAQDTHLAFDYTVLEVALMGRFPHLGAFELEGPADIALARAALAATGTLSFVDRTFHTLSGGERQRVVIAAALAQFETTAPRQSADSSGSQVLLLDEPTASLDLHYQVEIAALLKRLNRERGLTIVISTHDLNLAASLCDEITLLRKGRVVAHGPTAAVVTPENVEALYDVAVDVRLHDRAGHLTVVPLARGRI